MALCFKSMTLGFNGGMQPHHLGQKKEAYIIAIMWNSVLPGLLSPPYRHTRRGMSATGPILDRRASCDKQTYELGLILGPQADMTLS